MANPSISIVTINRNDAVGLRRTLRSIAALRALHPLELVVKDGGSTDGSLQVIEEELGAGTGTIVVSEPDAGIYQAMNTGWRLAHGQRIAFVNAGDEVRPEAFAAHLRAAAGSDADVIYAKTLVRVPETGATFVHERHPRHLDRDTVPHLTTLTRRAWLERAGGFDECYRIAADRDLFLRLRSAGATFAFFDDVVAVFELGGASSQKLRTRLENLRIDRANGLVGPIRFGVRRAVLWLRLRLAGRRGLAAGPTPR